MFSSLFIEILSVIKLFKNKVSIKSNPTIILKVNMGIFLTSMVIISSSIIYDVNFLDYEAPIEYSNFSSINWSNFRAIKRPHETLHGNNEYAFICSEINYKIKRNSIEITTLFHPSRSYTFSQEMASKNLLYHELYHLHITELWSRKLRNKLSKISVNSTKHTILETIKEYQLNERRMQKQYDEDSAHGYLLQIQRKWESRVDSSLLSLEQYSNPYIKFDE